MERANRFKKDTRAGSLRQYLKNILLCLVDDLELRLNRQYPDAHGMIIEDILKEKRDKQRSNSSVTHVERC